MPRSHLTDFSQAVDKEEKKESEAKSPKKESAESGSQESEKAKYAEIVCVEPPGAREKEARRIVRKNMLWSMGISIIPIPLVDFLGSIGCQAHMIKELSDYYHIPFTKHLMKNILAILLGGVGTLYIGQFLTANASRFIPFAGRTLSLAAYPIAAGALTYATGKVFIEHFESGGTILTFNPKKVRDYFYKEYEEGLEIAARMRAMGASV
ncbi:MAG: YcjF family protein [Candidatus Omnitrophota bacterium]